MASDSVRRIMAEVKELSNLNNAPNDFFHAAPLESDLFEWHFTVRGPPDTPFEEGVYHGRILLPPEYPLKPPEIILLTPNGRFETGKRICLSVTAHHQETWQPSWGIRTIITALVGFMPSRAEGVGALDYPDDDRRALARRSVQFRCERCGICPAQQLPPRTVGQSSEDGAMRSSTSPQPAPLPTATPGGSSSSAEPGPLSISSETEVAPQAQPSSSHPPPQKESSPILTQSQQTPEPPSESVQPQEQATNQTTPTNNRPQERGTQERELLYLAYAIAALMVAVIIRRLFKLLT